jgi:hypothetical protein
MEKLRFAFCALFLMGCSTTSGTADTDGQVAVDTGVDSGRGEVVIAADVVDVQEVGNLDVTVDTGLESGEIDAPAALCEPGEGCFLDPCEGNQDCLSGWCVQHLGESVCTQNCQEECPAGWNCQAVAGTEPDLVFVCVSDFANLCRPCSSNSDCTSTGGAEDACIDYGPGGNFCGGQCEGDGDCPWSFSCKDVTTVEGSSLKQCVNDTGECPCTDTSVALGLTTTCQVENEFGTCEGKRTCTEDGLTGCDAGIPGPETCNGINDDCDSETDEPNLVEGNYVNLCDDGNDCTEDKCMSGEGCMNEVLNEGTCDDGNACTLADHCETGTCLGTPVECTDDNPCTDDICTETGGCDFPSNQEPCDDNDACTVADQCAGGTCTGIPLPCECHEDADCLDLEDGDLCNGTLVCDTAGVPYKCVVNPNTVVTCSEPDGVDAFCQKASCEPETGGCSFVPDHEGFLCAGGDECAVNNVCINGECTGGGVVNCNDGNPCTEDACDPVDGCSHLTLGNGTPCLDQPGWQCMNGVCTCVGDCQDKECGWDFCGGSCGTCGMNEQCIEGLCVWSCTGTCDGKECGDDGCGNSCGDCPDGKTCLGGTCIEVCEPACDDKDCGSDGCGGLCGICQDGQACINGKCPPPGQECDDGNDIDWDGCTDGEITEWQVNLTWESGQGSPDVAVDKDGGFGIAWSSSNLLSGGYNQNIHFREFDTNCESSTGEKVINGWGYGIVGSFNHYPIVSFGSLDGPAIVWKASGPYLDKISCGSSTAVLASITGATMPAGDLCLEGGGGVFEQVGAPYVAASKDAHALVVWQLNGENNSGIYSRLYTPLEYKSQTKVKVDTTYGTAPIAAALTDGRFIVVWGPTGGTLYGQFMGPDGGKQGSEISLGTYGGGFEIDGAPDGGYVLVGQNGSATPVVFIRRYGSDGFPVGPEIEFLTLPQYTGVTPDITVKPDSSVVVVWSGANIDGDMNGVAARIINADNSFATDVFQVNKYTFHNQTGARIDSFSDGSFIIVWSSDDQDGDQSGIFAQRFNPDGTKKYK